MGNAIPEDFLYLISLSSYAAREKSLLTKLLQKFSGIAISLTEQNSFWFIFSMQKCTFSFKKH